MKQVISFLRELDANDDRVWFNAHKDQYLTAKATFDSFALELLRQIRSFDTTIGDLQLKDITYRIYRDVRFSKDKSPYKRHMGVFICPGGRKSGYSGYYFQVSGASVGNWEIGHMLAVGDYMTEPKVLKTLREDVQNGGGDFRKIMEGVDRRFSLDSSDALKKVPAGFPADSPDAEYFKLRRFCLVCEADEKFVTEGSVEQIARRVADLFRTATPFLAFVNRAVEFVKEERSNPWSLR